MKSGSGDDPFADATDEEAADPDEPVSDTTGALVETASESKSEAQSIPYKFRRDSVKEGRKQRPIFIRPDVEERESEFLHDLEDEVGEDVYKTDALEAALVIAMDHPDLVAEKLRDWGYDWD